MRHSWKSWRHFRMWNYPLIWNRIVILTIVGVKLVSCGDAHLDPMLSSSSNCCSDHYVCIVLLDAVHFLNKTKPTLCCINNWFPPTVVVCEYLLPPTEYLLSQQIAKDYLNQQLQNLHGSYDDLSTAGARPKATLLNPKSCSWISEYPCCLNSFTCNLSTSIICRVFK